jgi:hypothetical protein
MENAYFFFFVAANPLTKIYHQQKIIANKNLSSTKNYHQQAFYHQQKIIANKKSFPHSNPKTKSLPATNCLQLVWISKGSIRKEH